MRVSRVITVSGWVYRLRIVTNINTWIEDRARRAVKVVNVEAFAVVHASIELVASARVRIEAWCIANYRVVLFRRVAIWFRTLGATFCAARWRRGAFRG